MKRFSRWSTRNRMMKLLLALERRWRTAWAKRKSQHDAEVVRLKKHADKAESEAAETLRRVTRISYHHDRQFGLLAVTVRVPILELAYSQNEADYHWQHISRQLAYMLERECKQMSMATLAQAIRAAEERQRRMDDGYYRLPTWRLAE